MRVGLEVAWSDASRIPKGALMALGDKISRLPAKNGTFPVFNPTTPVVFPW